MEQAKSLVEEIPRRSFEEKYREEMGRNVIISTWLGWALEGINTLSVILADLTDGEIDVLDLEEDKRQGMSWREVCRFYHQGAKILGEHGIKERTEG